MWVIICETQGEAVVALVERKKVHSYVNNLRLANPNTVVRFARSYGDKCSPRLREFIDSMTPTQKRYYAKQDPFELVMWFNNVAKLYKPLPSEADLVRDDVRRAIAKLNWRE